MTKDVCSKCGKKKEGIYDYEIGWFYCFSCDYAKERAIADDLQRDYDYYDSLTPEQKGEFNAEKRLKDAGW